MSRPTDRDLTKLAGELSERMMRVELDLPVLLLRIQEWTPAATTSPNGDGVRGGGISNPTADKALPRTPPDRKDQWRDDEFTRARNTAIATLKGIQKLLDGYDGSVVATLAILEQSQAQRLAEQEAAVSSTCANPSCRNVISGLGNDRPRRGRCNACRVYEETHNGQERPHRLVHRVPLSECEQCMVAVR